MKALNHLIGMGSGSVSIVSTIFCISLLENTSSKVGGREDT